MAQLRKETTYLYPYIGEDRDGDDYIDTVPVRIEADLVAKLTAQSVTADTDILTSAFTATENRTSLLLVMTNTEGILSLVLDGVSGYLNDGDSLEASKWYAFEIPVTSGSTYNLQFSVDATLQIKWVVR